MMMGTDPAVIVMEFVVVFLIAIIGCTVVAMPHFPMGIRYARQSRRHAQRRWNRGER